MANEQSGVKFFVIFTIIMFQLPGYINTKDEGKDNPWLEIAQTLIQESTRNQKSSSGLHLLGGIVQGLMESEGGKQIGDVMRGSLMSGSGADLLTGLGALWQASMSPKGENAENSNVKEPPSFDPSVVGTVVDLISIFSKSGTSEDHKISKTDIGDTRTSPKNEEFTNWQAILHFAGNLLTSINTNQENAHGSRHNSGFESFISILPVLLSSLSGEHNIHASKTIPHHSHEPFLPPFLENLHEYWDHFVKSDFGKSLWENSGLSELAKLFTNSRGEFETEKIFESLGNNSFRRLWVKSISNFIAQGIKHFTNPEVHGKYFETAQLVCNGFFKSQGYPKEALLDIAHPKESISFLINAVFKRQFGLSVDSAIYVYPVVSYIQEIYELGNKKGFGMSQLSTQDIENKLAETLDNEVIEPILRVNRAYKFAMSKRACAKYVICSVNQAREISKSGLNPGITKLASLGASWFLSGNSNIKFLDFYYAASEEKDCTKYNKNCSEFDSEDLKATTDYFHNEL